MARSVLPILLLTAASTAAAACGGGHSAEAFVNADKVFDLSNIQIAEYRLGSTAAASYTFDDGPASSFAIAELFQARGLRATFFIIPGFVSDIAWPQWRAVAEHGHDVGNHSMTHVDLSDPALSDDQLSTQIVGARDILAARLGVTPTAFAFPYHKWSSRSAAVAVASHLATREPTLPFDRSYRVIPVGGASTAAALDAALNDAVANHEWVVFAGHGIDGDGWNPLPGTVLQAHLDYATAQPDVWIDTFRAIAEYQVARGQVRPSVVNILPSSVAICADGPVDPRLTGTALTLRIPFANKPRSVRAFDAYGSERPVKLRGDAILVPIYPEETIVIAPCGGST